MEEYASQSLAMRIAFGFLTSLILFLIGAAWMRARRISRAELRAFKELSRISGLIYHRPGLFRQATLIGNWRGRAMVCRLGINGLNIAAKVGGDAAGRAVLRYPIERRSPTWGISARVESTYHLNGEIGIIKRLADAEIHLDRVRNLVGEFCLSFRLKSSKRNKAPRHRKGRLIFRTSIAISASEQLGLLLRGLGELADFLEEGETISKP